ncbi:hypothetical protein EV379_3377 [Microterricola gilva]|uniref:Alpha/beta hydrolase family protein n=1 Tax=Microterricola gilva TaxID=393267 RepID=A0A4Q8AQJ3_9MICO|nr:hypothetical protein [Microterricola gilva]RZU67002.1 hypothetical protein EV379_3377 [Microterricola gilva]
MTDTLTLAGDGSTTVATEELLVDAARLGATQAKVEEVLTRIRQLLALDAGCRAEPGSVESLGEALHQLQAFGDEVARARAGLVLAAESYGLAERTVTALWGAGAHLAAWAAGRALPFLVVPAALSMVPLALLGLLVSGALGVAPARLPALLAAWIHANPGLLNSPAFVRLVRGTVTSGDEFAAGLLRVPAAVALPAGRSVGAEQGAAAIAALAVLAAAAGNTALRETPQRVHSAAEPRPVRPPRGVGELAARVPSSAPGSPQIRLERYGGAAGPRWVVYLAGTADFGPTPTREPFDLTANVLATADGQAASERAVRDALTAAGADPHDPLLVVGHSQGGLVAGRLAEAGDLTVTAYVNLGGPLGAVSADGVPGLSIEHSEDIVPALGGAAAAPAELLTVNRPVLDGADATAPLFAAHELERYRETARLIDGSEEARLVEFERIVRDFAGSAPGTETLWRSERLPRPGG